MTRNLSTEAKVTPTGLQQEIGMGPALAARIKTVTNHAALEAIVPTSGAPTFYCTGHTTAGDGGEGLWRWVAGNSDTANGGTILGGDAAGRWKRQFSGPINVKWFGDVDELLSYCAANRAVDVYFPAGVYDFDGKTIPTGVNFSGPGWLWASGNTYGGFGLNAAVLTGDIVQGVGPSSSTFRGLVFADGTLTLMKQYNKIDNCAFTGDGGGLVLDQSLTNAAPYYNTISNSFFRGIINNPCVRLKGQANANYFSKCVFLVGQNERGVVAEFTTEGPLFCAFVSCGFERASSVTAIGSFVYGDFKSATFLGNYFDAVPPTLNDGAAYVFGSNSRNNRIWHGQTTSGETVINNGFRNTFRAAGESDYYFSPNAGNLGDSSGIPEQYTLGAAVETTTLPELVQAKSQSFRLTTIRSAGVTLSPGGSDTINGASSLFIGQYEVWLFYHRYGGVASTTDWVAVQISRPVVASATASEIADIADAVNVDGKYLGREVWDSTNSEFLKAAGATAGSVWKNMNGGSDITPS